MDRPNPTLGEIFDDAKNSISSQVSQTMQKNGIPPSVMEYILMAVLSDLREDKLREEHHNYVALAGYASDLEKQIEETNNGTQSDENVRTSEDANS